MKTYTYSEARQHFAALLDEARRAGSVQIRRRDGRLFVLQPAKQERSPLDVPGVDVRPSAGDSAAWLREEREASADRLLERASGAPVPTDAESKR
jgi:antitoxin (DNA-binding transcriptional repressor) of toxin-antitoxin stability system